jgi:YegS/Rv2252/BmrU family lipid kinase
MPGHFYTFIFNPAADKGRAALKAEWLIGLLAGRGNAALETTMYAGHAGEIAHAAIDGSSTLIACGGDGTVNEVINAVAASSTPVRVGVLPIGSANDFLKTFNPRKHGLTPDIHGFFRSESRKVDRGAVNFSNGSRHYFINSLGIGLTGKIARSVRDTGWIKGDLCYVHALFSVLLGYTPPKMHIKITFPGGIVELHEHVFAFSVLNGKIEGGKFLIAPSADPSDGLLDVCILKAIPKWFFLNYVFKYMKGSHIHDSRVVYCKASAIDVIIPEPDVMHMDGEVFDGVCGQISISVDPGAVDMLYDC